MTDRTFTRLVVVGAATLFLALMVGVAVNTWQVREQSQEMKKQARAICERFNKAGAAEQKLWRPVLAKPRAALRPNATAEERAAYDEDTRIREGFERDLRAFDPIDCG